MNLISDFAHAVTAARSRLPFLTVGNQTRPPEEWELDVVSFIQGWPNTTLGNGGVGGQAFTSALTTVVMASNVALVYIGPSLAYRVDHPSEAFHQDLAARNMAGRIDARTASYTRVRGIRTTSDAGYEVVLDDGPKE